MMKHQIPSSNLQRSIKLQTVKCIGRLRHIRRIRECGREATQFPGARRLRRFNVRITRALELPTASMCFLNRIPNASTGGAKDGSPRREPWDKSWKQASPGGAKENHATNRYSVAPPGLGMLTINPRLAPWATVCRCSAARNPILNARSNEMRELKRRERRAPLAGHRAGFELGAWMLVLGTFFP